ncbi:MAG: tRNA (N6-threonylcarbamoyladenosine(37)-N6)-methyltransferase TrmO [Candidatus Saliniplasma sp.]
MKESSKRKFEVVEVGKVENDFLEEVPDDYHDKTSKIIVRDEFTDSLLGIEENSHISVLCWLDRSDRSIQRVHPMADKSNPLTGVFSTRSPVRPNPISYTVCELIERVKNVLHVKGLDMLDATPVIDIKSYTTKYNIESPCFPDWVPERDRSE